MSFEIQLNGEPLVVLAVLDEAETMAYAVGREHDIANVTIVYTPSKVWDEMVERDAYPVPTNT